ncbi:transcriptional regulator [Gammaproteobacteria bacterium]|jgi:predicted DNA-binding transcriptional regulator AlpA|nr:transcriptional regulator [Gammaproteobacteria bacterium]
MNFLTVQDLVDMGFGSRVTIWKKVKHKEFPAPMKFGNGVNAPNRWLQEDIDNYISQIRMVAQSKGAVMFLPRVNN